MAGVTINEAANPLAALVPEQAGPKAKSTEPEDRFLTLLVTQLKNQDPLNPLANAELTSQLAQISTVQGIGKLNGTLASLAGDIAASRNLQAASLVGRQVLVPGASLALEETGARAGFRLEQPVERLAVVIVDASGAPIHRVELGALPAGVHLFEWDGMADSGARAVNGRYAFTASGSAGDQQVEAAALSLGRVDGVSHAQAGAVVTLGGLGDRPFADIQRIM
jgi:flagellar basal-body rod modification protein FlgD